jgi:ribose-phosphate pyrophosphokinase
VIQLNGRPVEFDNYPNYETLIDGLALSALASQPDIRREETWDRDHHTMTFAYESDGDLVRLMFVRRYLGDNATVDLTIRYMPYSRMDRAERGSVFTLRYVADFINSLDFASVVVEEPHSDVTCALLDRSTAVYPTVELLPDVLERISFNKAFDYLFFPDAGAQKRYAKVLGYKTAVGFKHRDFATGKLSGEMDVVGFDWRTGAGQPVPKVLILDDLCSYGGTFVMAANKLREMGADKVYLFVAHCEHVMWDGELLDRVDGLYTTDSILPARTPQRDNSQKVHIYSEGRYGYEC